MEHFRGLLSAAAIALVLGGAARAGDASAAREAVGKPVQAAQALLKQNRPKEAIARLRQAEAVKDQTPYETYVIAETRAAAEIAQADYAAATASLETVLATHVLSPPESAQRLQTLTQLAYERKTYPAVVAYAQRYYAQGGAERTPRVLMAQAEYLGGDFRAAARTLRAQLLDDMRAGRAPPDEDLLLTLASSESKAGNDTGYRDALTRLVSAHPKREYWIDLLAALARHGLADRLRLDLDRFRLAVDAFAAPAQYTEAAERALSAGFPGDARAFLDHGFVADAFGAQAGRARRLADLAARQAAEDAERLPARATAAGTAETGATWETLGETYASYGDAAHAIAALNQSLRKGGLAHPEDATLHLGVACLHAGQTDRAKQLLSSLAEDGAVGELAHLWLIHDRLETRIPLTKDPRP